jgi:hypothetical protein
MSQPLRHSARPTLKFNIGAIMTDKLRMWIAWHMPRSIVYWCAIRVGAHATQGKYSNQNVPELLFMDALQRWQ